MNEKNDLTCTVKILPSGTLGGLWVAMRTPESDAVTPKVTVTEPDPSRVMLIDDYWGWEWGWWTPNIAKNYPYAFKVEFDVLNGVYPSSVMYKPWVLAKLVEKLSKRDQTYSERSISIQDDLLGMITWRIDGIHCWFWFFEDAREACFESVSTWPAGSISTHNRLDTDRLTSQRFESSRTTERLSNQLHTTECPLTSLERGVSEFDRHPFRGILTGAKRAPVNSLILRYAYTFDSRCSQDLPSTCTRGRRHGAK